MKFHLPAMLRYHQFAVTLVTAGFIASTAAGASAQDASPVDKSAAKKHADPSGTWRWESEQQGQTVKHELKLNYDAALNRVKGSYKGSGDPVQIDEGRMKGNQLFLSLKFEREGVNVTVDTEAVIDGDSIQATSTFNADGNTGSLKWSAKRSLQASDVIGKWELEIQTDNGPMTVKLIISNDEDQLKGEYSGFDGRFQTEAKDITVRDGKLTFSIMADVQDNSLTANYVVTPRSDSLTGKVEYDFNGNSGELEVSGKRSAN